MLKSTLNIKKNVDFKNFTKLVIYLKKLLIGNDPMKSKVVLILGISGACKMTVDDIEDKDSILIIKIPDTKRNIQRIFTVSNLDYIDIYQTYAALRSSCATSRRLFFRYKNKRCFNQVVGINHIGKMPKLIAKYLKLPNFNAYTATLLANAGSDICSLKRHGRMKIFDRGQRIRSSAIASTIAFTSKTDSFPNTTPISRAGSDLSGLGINIGSCTG
ncbi:hypothetical protein NQ317_018979 [Molorchus minor]|uniref:Uncharacterized protein n=1 Tax=Molorchus minor TaxID=1323400 RepID=A0ABQ9ITA9_9CUCU|nr:hypothetical protein NQ317_018979 [Molorchus minor]